MLKKANEIEGLLMGRHGVDEITAKVADKLPDNQGPSLRCLALPGTLPLARVCIPVECTDSAGRLTSRLVVSGQERKKINLPPLAFGGGWRHPIPPSNTSFFLYMPF
jgi:hypothetical protein